MGVIMGWGFRRWTLEARLSSLDSVLPKPEADAIHPKAGGHH